MENNQHPQGTAPVPPFFPLWPMPMAGMPMPPPPPGMLMPGAPGMFPPGNLFPPWMPMPMMTPQVPAPKQKKQQSSMEDELLRFNTDTELQKWTKDHILTTGRDPTSEERENERRKIWMTLKKADEEKKEKEIERKRAEVEEKIRKFEEEAKLKQTAVEKLEAVMNKGKVDIRSPSPCMPKAYGSRRDRKRSPERVSSSSDAVFHTSKASEIQKILRTKKEVTEDAKVKEESSNAMVHLEPTEEIPLPAPLAVQPPPPPPPPPSLAALQAAPPPPPPTFFAKVGSLLGPSSGPTVKLGALTIVSPALSTSSVSEPAIKKARTESFSSGSSATPSSSSTSEAKECTRKRARKSRFEPTSTPSTPHAAVPVPPPPSSSRPVQVVLPPPGLVCPLLSEAAPPPPPPPLAAHTPPPPPPVKIEQPPPAAQKAAAQPRQIIPGPPPYKAYIPPLKLTTGSLSLSDRYKFYKNKTAEQRRSALRTFEEEVLLIDLVKEAKTGVRDPNIKEKARKPIDRRKSLYYQNFLPEEFKKYRDKFVAEIDVIQHVSLKENLAAAERKGQLQPEYGKVAVLKNVLSGTRPHRPCKEIPLKAKNGVVLRDPRMPQ